MDLATANIGLISDIIACPGMDYCSLATARSIPIAQEIATHFDALKQEHDIGALKIKISGCINACGHHHVGHIGILGLDRAGVESYQITLGGDGSETAAIGERVGQVSARMRFWTQFHGLSGFIWTGDWARTRCLSRFIGALGLPRLRRLCIQKRCISYADYYR